MKLPFLFLLFASIVVAGFVIKKIPAHKERQGIVLTGDYEPIAVLELFTSEGCSSCPPADKLLPELEKLDNNIIPLSFHVDYWNRLGWTDPFSSTQYSERQRIYSDQFKLESVYTPQLIVNGETELVGSDRGKATAAVRQALAEQALVRLSVQDVLQTGEKLSFAVIPGGEFKKTDIIAVLVQNNAMMQVKAGENKGATLSHVNVVRAFEKQTALVKNEFHLEIPTDIKKDGWIVVVYAQQKNNLKITGAAKYQPTIPKPAH
ncbi:MAG: DUF1223 domain-containing protein [Chitinophagaceae bacterium]